MFLLITIYDKIFTISGEEVTEHLKILSNLPEWHPTGQCESLGYCNRDGIDVHYIMNTAFDRVLSYIMNTSEIDYAIILDDNMNAPIDQFEEWEMPSNQQEAIWKGYMSEDDHFSGGWRCCPPVL